MNEHISPDAEETEAWEGGVEGDFREQRSLFHQPFGHICIGDFYLFVTGAGVGELFACVSIVQVLPDGRHLFGDVEASVLLGHDLVCKKKRFFLRKKKRKT